MPKPVPEIVTDVPELVGPFLSLTNVRTGASYEKRDDRVAMSDVTYRSRS
jgi:hypothetical protein